MKVITYLTTIDLGEEDRFHFCYDRGSVRFLGPNNDITLYFQLPQSAMNFITEIVEAIYNGVEIVDLSYMIAIPNFGTMGTIEYEVRQRITSHKQEKDEDNEEDK